MDPLKLVSSIGNTSNFGNSGSDIHNDEEVQTIGSRSETPEKPKGKPKKNTVLHPPDGGKFAWKMVGICFTLTFCKEMLRNLVEYSDGLDDDIGKELAKNICILFNGFSKFGGVFAALVTLKYGYGLVGIVGSVMAASGLLMASLMTPSLKDLIAIVVSCISGIGCGFMEYAILIVSLEYFSTKRVKVLIIINIAAAVANVIFTILLEVKAYFPQVVLPWSLTFRYQAIGMAGAVIASGFIRTLDLEPEPEVKKVYRHHHMHYSDFSPRDWNGLTKDLTFYLYAILFLLYDFGEHIPEIKQITDSQKWAFSSDELLSAKFVPYMGLACSCLLMCLWKSQTFANILAVLGPINFIAGLATCVILPYTDFDLIIFYGIIFTLAKYCILWMLLDVIPDEFGRNNTRICLGIVCFIAGACEVGSAYARESAENFVVDPTEKFKAVFILGGALIMVSGLFGVCIRCFIVSFKDPELRRPRGEV